MLGFLTSITTAKDGVRMGVVYVPTAPTPNSGWVAMLPIDEVYDTELSVQEAMTLVLSGGIATPDEIVMTEFDEDRAPTCRTSGGAVVAGHRGSLDESASIGGCIPTMSGDSAIRTSPRTIADEPVPPTLAGMLLEDEDAHQHPDDYADLTCRCDVADLREGKGGQDES